MGIVIRQSLKATAMHYIGVVLGIFVSFYVMLKYLDPAVIGLTKVVYEVAFLLSAFALMGTASSGMRFFSYFKDEKSGHHGFFYYYLLFPVVGVAVFSLLYLLLKAPLVDFFSKKDAHFGDYFYYVLPLFWVLTFWQFFENYANIHMRIAVPKAVREVGMRLLQLAIFVLYGLGWLDVSGLIIAYVVCYGLCLLTTGVYSIHIGGAVMKHDWSYVTPELRGKVLRYTAFLMLAAISNNVLAQMDIFQLTNLRGLYDAGIYTIVIYMAEVVNMPSRSITPISAPLAAQAMKDGDTSRATDLYRQVSVHQMLAASVLLFFVWINLDNIFAIIPNGDKFAAGRYAVLFLGLSKVVYSTLNFGNTLLSFSRYYYWTLVVAIVLTFVSYGTNLYFIPIFGLSGAALATLMASLLSFGFQQGLVSLSLHSHPFTWRHLRVVAMIAVLYGLNMLIPTLLDEQHPLTSAIADGALRSAFLAIVATILMYKLHISEQINGIIDHHILRR